MAAIAACARGMLDVVRRRAPHLGFRVLNLRCLVSTTSYQHGPAMPPKRPPSAFAAFVQSNMSEISRNNPDMKQSDRMRVAASLWKQLDSAEKEMMKNTASERLKQYAVSYQTFLSQLSPDEMKEMKEVKQKKRKALKLRRQRTELKKHGRPKGPRNAFTLFVSASKLERGNTSITTFMKGLVDYWKVMPPEEKQIYAEDARVDRVRYDEEMKEWEAKMKEEGREDLIRVKSRTVIPKRKKAKKKAASSKSKKQTRRKSAANSKKRGVVVGKVGNATATKKPTPKSKE